MTFGDYLFLGFLVVVFLGFWHLLAKQDKERQKAYKQGFFDACNCKRPDCHLFYNDNYLAHSPTGDEDLDDLAGYTYPYERTKLYKLGYDSCKFDVDFQVQYHGKYFPGFGGDLKSFDELMEFVRQHEEFVKSHDLLD